MSAQNKAKAYGSRYWGSMPVPSSKAEFFNAVTTPAPAGSGTVATIRMYGPIDSWGGWWGISTADIGEVLDALPETVTQIILRVNSPGGEVFEGISILNMLRAHKASVTAVVDGLAASAASVIAAGCDETVMSPGTQMMIHSPSTIVWGNASEMRKTADVLDGIEASIIEIYDAKAGTNDWAALLAEETWLPAADAVSLGLADRVAVVPDAGEAETVGQVLTVDEPDPGEEVEDSTRLRVAAVLANLPSPTGPGELNRKEGVVAYDDLKNGLRARLGVTDVEASDEVLLEALDATLTVEPAVPVLDAAALPEGVQVIDSAVLADLQAQAAQGVAARAEQDAQRRDGMVRDALTDGRIAPASADTWRAQLDANEEGTAALLASLPSNKIPVTEIGGATVEDSADAAIEAWAAGEKKGA